MNLLLVENSNRAVTANSKLLILKERKDLVSFRVPDS
jgi:hypothetical protein